MDITTNYEKAVEVSKVAVGMLEKKVYPFSKPDLFPDAILPQGIEKGSLQHALFLFYAVSLDHGRDSRTLYNKCRQMWQKLDFTDIPEMDESYIKFFLHNNFEKPKTSDETFGDPVGTWIKNSQKLLEGYENDPRKLKSDTIEKTCKNIRKFRGFGSETPWLLIKNYIKAGIWQFPQEEIRIKIDRHAIRISLGAKVIEVKGADEIRYDILVPYLSDIYSKVIKQEKISPIDLNDSFWAIGSYRCNENNAIYCGIDCPMSCKIKPTTDRAFTTINPNKDSRENPNNLFNYKD
jgi:hypothetical protein